MIANRHDHKLQAPLTLSYVLFCIMVLSSCSSIADPKQMVAPQLQGESDYPPPLRRSMCARNVSGAGEGNQPVIVIATRDQKLENADLKEALTNSLAQSGLLATTDSACRYFVDLNVLGLSEPSAGFSMEVTAHINYKVFDTSGRAVFLETISSPYTAQFSEAFAGSVRIRRAIEGAIRSSISQFLSRLRMLPLTS